jgi:hypothetical protein
MMIKKNTLLVSVIVLLTIVAVGTIISVTSLGSKTGTLPPGCTRPPGGFLIIAGTDGFNNSVGRPNTVWPVIAVKRGSTVNITVCNIAPYSHGFQIAHYYNSSIVTIDSNQVIRVSFVAEEIGTFRIYCAVFCPIHFSMQNGRLTVSP